MLDVRKSSVTESVTCSVASQRTAKLAACAEQGGGVKKARRRSTAVQRHRGPSTHHVEEGVRGDGRHQSGVEVRARALVIKHPQRERQRLASGTRRRAVAIPFDRSAPNHRGRRSGRPARRPHPPPPRPHLSQDGLALQCIDEQYDQRVPGGGLRRHVAEELDAVPHRCLIHKQGL